VLPHRPYDGDSTYLWNAVDNYFTRQYIPEDKSELCLYKFLLSILLLRHECSYRVFTLIISCLYLYSNLISRASVSVFFFLALIFPLPKRWLNGDFVVPPICCVAFYKDLRKQLNCSKTYYYWPTEHKKSCIAIIFGRRLNKITTNVLRSCTIYGTDRTDTQTFWACLSFAN
jgi:hypothetical protein